MRRIPLLLVLAALLAPSAALRAQQAAPASPIARIQDEGLNRSQVMKTAAYLTDVIGPRLTGSPQLKRANEWTRDTLASWGLQKAAVETWGTFGRGWSLHRFSAQVVEPQAIPLIAYPKAWSRSTNGPITAQVVYLDPKDEADLERFHVDGKLRGAIVFITPPREVKPHFEPRATRKSDQALLDLANASPSGSGRRRAGGPPPGQNFRGEFALTNRKLRFAMEEGAGVLVEASRAGDDSSRPSDGGTVFVSAASVPQPPGANPLDTTRRVTPYQKNAPRVPPQIVLAAEHYNRIVRLLQAGEKVTMSVDLAVQFHEEDLTAANTVAEIPGTDLADEIVMLGGHMDSWHAGTGATDNAAGVSVAMEVVRILQTLQLKPRRTIRIALWTGEEQGLLGSRAYVAEHFGKFDGPPAAAGQPRPAGRLVTKPEFEKLSAYFNLDNGSGKIRGIHLQGNEQLRTLFREWLTPFRDLGATTISSISVGGTDHTSFDAIGLPAFQFIQDDLEYATRTHHSNQDVYDRLQADDLKQASVVMAAFVYQAATLDKRLPRKATAPPSPIAAGAAPVGN